jgi:hypothetical protein
VSARTNLLLAALHSAGATWSIYALFQIWAQNMLLRLLLGRDLIIYLTGGYAALWMWALVGVIAVSAVFGYTRAVVRIRQWQRSEAVEDAAVRLRIALYAAMACLAYNVFALSTPEGFSGPFRLRHPIAGVISAALAYSAWCVLPRLRHRVSPKWRRRFDLLGMNASIALVLAEVVLRTASMFWASPLLLTDASPSQIRRDSERKEPGALWFSYPVNSGGHYDTEFLPREERDRPLVVNIGDSFSYGTVPLPYHYTSVAERIFPSAEVYNMGYPGIDPVDYLYLLVEEALPLEPDLVVIALFVGNDITSLERTQNTSRWHDAESYLLGVVFHRLQVLRRADTRDWTTGDDEISADDLTAKYPWLTDPMQEFPSMGDGIFRDLEARNALAVGGGLPGIYERFAAMLHEIEAAADDVPLAFLLIPDEFQVEDHLWDIVSAKAEIQLQRDLPQQRIGEWARAGRRDVVDLLPLLLAAEPLADGRRHVYHLTDTHFNARGNEIAGRALAELIETKLAQPNPAAENVALPLKIAFGEPESRQWMEDGWSYDEPGHVWSDGQRSSLKIRLRADTDLRLRVDCMPFDFPNAPEQRIKVVLNRTPVGEITITPGQTEYTIVLPKDALKARSDRLEFVYAYTRTPNDVLPNSADERPLAIAWRSLEFSRIADR